MRFRYLYVCWEPDSPVIATKNKCVFAIGCSRAGIKIDTHQSLFPCPIAEGVFFRRVNGNSVFCTHEETLVLTWENCIDIIGNQCTVVCMILMDELLFIDVIYKQSSSTSADI